MTSAGKNRVSGVWRLGQGYIKEQAEESRKEDSRSTAL